MDGTLASEQILRIYATLGNQHVAGDDDNAEDDDALLG